MKGLRESEYRPNKTIHGANDISITRIWDIGNHGDLPLAERAVFAAWRGGRGAVGPEAGQRVTAGNTGRGQDDSASGIWTL